MTFRLQDVKKTIRSRSDGHRYIHPALLDGAVTAPAVGLALAYLASRAGRPRREVDPDVLLRFFGDTRVARGLVACMAGAYRWRSQGFAEVVDAKTAARLARHDIFTPSDLRLYLFGLVNTADAQHGFLAGPYEDVRAANLTYLGRGLRLSSATIDLLIALDAEENAVLIRTAAAPSPHEVVALYNFSAVDALLRNSISVEIETVSPAARKALDEAGAAHGVAVAWRGADAWVHNRPDAFGSYARAGSKLARVLYAALSADPRLLTRGRAEVAGPKVALYPFGKDTATVLTGGTGVVLYAPPSPQTRVAWEHMRSTRATRGWSMIAAPEPLLTPSGLVVAPYAYRRDETLVRVLPVATPDALAAVTEMVRSGAAVLAVAPAALIASAEEDAPVVSSDADVAETLDILDARWGGGRIPAAVQVLDALLDQVKERRFIPEGQIADALHCASTDDLAARLRVLGEAHDGETRAVYVPGVGLCAPAFAEAMRRGLRRKPRQVA